MITTPSEDDDEPATWKRDDDRLHRRYLELHADLLDRDRVAQRDPLALQRWPMERTSYADHVDRARQEWESHHRRVPVDAEGRSGDPGDPEHDQRDEWP